MRVKICGLTRAADVVSAVSAGADAIGINLVAGPRQVDLATADRVAAAVGPMVTPVALVRLRDGEIEGEELEWVSRRWISHLQLYGEVSGGSIRRLAGDGFRVIYVTHVKSADFPEEVNALLAECGDARPAAVLLDAFNPAKAGGSGETFRWSWVRQAREQGQMDDWPPVLLAGGLRPENVAEAVRETTPCGVDVASGVESAPGEKDIDKMCAFVAAAKAALQRHRE